MTTSCVDCALFTANHKVIDISHWESHSGNSDRLRLIVHQLHALLPKHSVVIFPSLNSLLCQRQHGKIIWLNHLFAFSQLCQRPCFPAPDIHVAVHLWFQVGWISSVCAVTS